jgi:hypothetical protein
MTRFVPAAFLTVLLLSSPTFAQEEKAAPIEQLDARTEEILKGLDKNQTLQFSAIRNSHGTIRAVENVQSSLDRAVRACGKANPDLNAQVTAEFDGWKEGVRPVLKQARAKLDKMIYLQSFAKPSEVRSYLRLFDDVVAWRDAKIKAEPVTARDECEKLSKKMEKTREELIELIKENLALDQPVAQEKS